MSLNERIDIGFSRLLGASIRSCSANQLGLEKWEWKNFNPAIKTKCNCSFNPWMQIHTPRRQLQIPILRISKCIMTDTILNWYHWFTQFELKRKKVGKRFRCNKTVLLSCISAKRMLFQEAQRCLDCKGRAKARNNVHRSYRVNALLTFFKGKRWWLRISNRNSKCILTSKTVWLEYSVSVLSHDQAIWTRLWA